MPLHSAPDDLDALLRHLAAAAAFLSFDVNAELDDKDYAGLEVRSDMADLVSALARQAVALYNAELDARTAAQLSEALA